MHIARRDFLLGLVGSLVTSPAWGGIATESQEAELEPGAASEPGADGPFPVTRSEIEAAFATVELRFDSKARSMQLARVYVPRALDTGREWPVAVLLHGYAQALGQERALRAWKAEYDVLAAYTRLARGIIPTNRALGADRAAEIEELLRRDPFQGMVLVTPVTPIPYFQRDLDQALAKYSRWIHQSLLPRVAQVAPISTEPSRIGLAGVSMGGLVGLELISRYPKAFGAFCGIEIAIRQKEAYRFASRLKRAFNAMDEGSSGRPIRVLTATRDTYRWSNQALYQALRRNNFDVSLEVRRGGHSSRWMREAGSMESLLWLDRVLHRGSTPSD